MTDDKNPTDDRAAALDEMTFRQASEELESIVRLLESNQLELEESLKYYERGVLLLKTLQGRLKDAQQKITVLLGEIEPVSDDGIDTGLS
ncbi:MAG TPA: exodeoxyribonuclease VII small subunit [Coriobacteriia bacterium]|nr:exodeoxyribonuclease VII small subunit [Coriobacteriia bacterium]